MRFDFITGLFVNEFTNTDLNQACGHAWDADGNLYVASYGSADVRKFDTDGKFLGVFTEAGRLRGAVNLWFGESGDLFVVDWILGSVLRFDGRTGRFKANFITGMQNTEGFVFDPDSALYLCDWSRNTVNRYDRSGRLLSIFANSGDMRAPNGVVFGTLPATTVTQREYILQNFALQQNYPNPFNPSTTIGFNLPRATAVELIVFDLTGREVMKLASGFKHAGEYKLNFKAHHLPSGVYVYRLRAGDFVQSQKMILLR